MKSEYFASFKFSLCFYLTLLDIMEKSTSTSEQLDPVLREDNRVKYKTGKAVIEWDFLQEPWLNFQVRLCGKICNGTRYLDVRNPAASECSQNCFLCDCDVTCPIYGTCCPQIDSTTPLAQEDVLYNLEDNRAQSWFFTGNLSDYRLFDANDDPQRAMHYPELKSALVFKGRFQCSTACSTNRRGCDHFYMISTCPPSETNQTLRDLCERDSFDDVTSSGLTTPFSDIRNGVSYTNIHCAKCNQPLLYYNSEQKSNKRPTVVNLQATDYDTHLRRWEIHVNCPSYQDFYTINSEEEFLKVVFENARNYTLPPSDRCQLNMQPPLDSKWTPRQCSCKLRQSLRHDEADDTSCSQSDPTPVYTTLSTMCHRLSSPAYQYAFGNNVFCSLCNDTFPQCRSNGDGDISTYSSCVDVTDDHGSGDTQSPLAVVLGPDSVMAGSVLGNYRNRTESYVNMCFDRLEWSDDQGMCQLPRCALGKRLNVVNETCDSVMANLNGLRYQVAMLLLPASQIPATSIPTLQEAIVNHFRFVMRARMTVQYLIHNSSDSSDVIDYVKYVMVSGRVQAMPNMSRDAFERWYLSPILETLTNQSLFEFFNESRILLGGETMHAILMTKFNNTIHDPLYRTATQVNWSDVHSKPSNISLTSEPSFKEAVTFQIKLNDYWIIEHNDHVIDLNPSLVCPFVELTMSAVTFEGNDEIKIAFFYQGDEKVYNVWDEGDQFSIVNGKIRICIDVFKRGFQNKIGNWTHFQYANGNGNILSTLILVITICLCISIASLNLTIITYLLFPVLRTLAGLNTMALSICLASAQLCVVFLLQFERKGMDEGFCQLLGFAFHYSWLASFHWMHVCCIHMFRVFRSTQSPRGASAVLKPFLKYSAYTFGTSAFYVVINVTLCHVISNGRSTGYHPQHCIIDVTSILPPLVSFIAPLAIVVFTNVILFGLTIAKIIATRRLQGRSLPNKSRDEIFTYVKLSTVTGLFWLLLSLSIFLRNWVISYVCAIMACLQGVFIFVSFTFNARVKGLYLDLCRNLLHRSSEANEHPKP